MSPDPQPLPDDAVEVTPSGVEVDFALIPKNGPVQVDDRDTYTVWASRSAAGSTLEFRQEDPDPGGADPPQS